MDKQKELHAYSQFSLSFRGIFTVAIAEQFSVSQCINYKFNNVYPILSEFDEWFFLPILICSESTVL